MKKIIFMIIILLSTTAKSENINELLNNKKCVFNENNFTFQIFGSNGVFYKVGEDLSSFNETIKANYNLGFTRGNIVNIEMPEEIKSQISQADDKIQYYQLCYKLEKI